MALLSQAKRDQITQQLMQKMSVNHEGASGYVKTDVGPAVAAVDAVFDATVGAEIIAAMPLPFRTASSQQTKAWLVDYIVRARYLGE